VPGNALEIFVWQQADGVNDLIGFSIYSFQQLYDSIFFFNIRTYACPQLVTRDLCGHAQFWKTLCFSLGS